MYKTNETGKSKLKCSLGLRYVAYKHNVNLEQHGNHSHNWFGEHDCDYDAVHECMWCKPRVRLELDSILSQSRIRFLN